MRQIAVYGAPSRAKPPTGRINYGAVIAVVQTNQKNGCKAGWGKLTSGKFVCTAHLSPTDKPLSPALDDSPDIDADVERYIVTKGGAITFKNREAFGRRKPGKFLYRGTVLAVKRKIVRGNTTYLITRNGQYVQGDNVEKMNPVWSLGSATHENTMPLVGYIINDSIPCRISPNENADVTQTLHKFHMVFAETVLLAQNGWVSIPSCGYVKDIDVARIRQMTPPATLENGEKWIAVDLAEQTVAAYEGNQRVFVALASTGKKGNTEPGNFRVKWKRRMQTMNLYGGHLRVDDVQWVMYYIPQRGFALHSAWHNNFGHPVSHGCVNLPRDDARWLYEWASPHSEVYDSENMHSDDEKGTRVIVF